MPAHQVAFYCFNDGDLAAMSFAAGLPWLALYQAQRMPGYRDKSRGLLEAVAQARGLYLEPRRPFVDSAGPRTPG